jgi:uncharacterized membrane protein YqhA
MKKYEQIFEGLLWRSRLIVLMAVVVSIAASLSMFFIATVDAVYTISHLTHYASPDLNDAARNDLRGTTVAHVVEVVDGYLLGTILLIFGLGLYELFISKIDQAERSETSSSVLLIRSLDDLKSRLAKVILLILIVKFFEKAIDMEFDGPLNLLYLAIGILLIGATIFITHAQPEHGPKAPAKSDEAEHK